jgi:hypothetical protein
VFGFTAHLHNLGHMAAKQENIILAKFGCYKLKATPGIKITSPAGVKRCIDPEPIQSSLNYDHAG